MKRIALRLCRRLARAQRSALIPRVLAAGVVALTLAAGPGIPRAEASGYTITDLGSLGGSRTMVSRMNNLGQVVGWSSMGQGSSEQDEGFLYDSAGMHALNPLLGGSIFTAAGINDAGRIVGTAIFGSGSSAPRHAFLYDGALHDLTPTAPAWSGAAAVNANGHVAGWTQGFIGSDLPMIAFFYDGTALHSLGTLPEAGSCPRQADDGRAR